MTEPKQEDITVRCPQCGAEVKVDDKARETMVVKCPKGHKIDLVKAI